MYSDFYEIPLPALRFEKVEETDTIKVINDTEENDAFQIDHILHKRKRHLKQEKQNFTRQRRHAEEKLNDANQTRTKDLKITKSSHLF